MLSTDSLCIIQDDIEDWKRKGSKMAQTYSGTYITLAATSATASHRGFYRERSTIRDRNKRTYTLPDHKIGSASYNIHVIESFNLDLINEDLPLLKGAWAFQERLLAPRLVHFGEDMLHWECLTDNCHESGTGISFLWTRPEKTRIMGPPASSSPSQTLYQVTCRRYEIVSGNTSGNLTFSKDKLPALQGIAKRVQSERRCAYYAGLWEDTTCLDLAWYHWNPTTSPIEYRAPSWSWASTEGPVLYSVGVDVQCEASLVHVQTVLQAMTL
jgi:hypothetical protein